MGLRDEPSFSVVSGSVASMFGSMDVLDVNREGKRRYPTLIHDTKKNKGQHIEYPKETKILLSVMA